MPLIPALLPALDTCRTIEGRLGMRVYTVTVRQRIWTGERPGVGAYTDFDTPLVNVGTDGFTCPVHVKELSRKDIIASGGLYVSGDLRVGPMTPSYQALFTQLAAGYNDQNALDPKPMRGRPVEMIWIVNSEGRLPKDSVFQKVDESATSMHFNCVLRSTGRRL